MKVKVISKTRNPLLKRNEIVFGIEHSQTGGTPTRVAISKQLATSLKVDLSLVLIKKIQTKTGTMYAIGQANIYDSKKQVELVEPKHLITRNLIPEKPKDSKKPKEKENKEES